jgi:3-oxoacyl-[acyl-carrier-protein] synthase II
MTKKRIVVTGMGLVSPLGNDVDTFYQQLLLGKSAISFIDSFNVQDYPTRFAGVIRNLDTEKYIQKKQARRVDPFIRYALVAGKKALEQSQLTPEAIQNCNQEKIGVILGSGMGGMQAFLDGADTILHEGYKRLTPFFVPFIITNMAGALLAIDMGFKGPNFSISTACATANYSILAAAGEILSGRADIMVTGGTEAAINPVGLSGFTASRAISTRNEDPEKASRPWDKNRDGFVMAEGAGVLVLESLDHALKRNAPIFAEFLGGSWNCDAYHMTDTRDDGSVAAHCMEDAIKNSGIRKEDINYINPHATSTLVGDVCELRAIKRVFDGQTNKIKMNATKSLTGHCLGAAGGIEAIATIMAIRTKELHPTLNLDDPIEELEGFDVVGKEKVHHEITAALSNSFGFGGHNSSIVFAPYRP